MVPRIAKWACGASRRWGSTQPAYWTFQPTQRRRFCQYRSSSAREVDRVPGRPPVVVVSGSTGCRAAGRRRRACAAGTDRLPCDSLACGVPVERQREPHGRLVHGAVRSGVGPADGARLDLLPGQVGHVLPAAGGPLRLRLRVGLVLVLVALVRRGDPAAQPSAAIASSTSSMAASRSATWSQLGGPFGVGPAVLEVRPQLDQRALLRRWPGRGRGWVRRCGASPRGSGVAAAAWRGWRRTGTCPRTWPRRARRSARLRRCRGRCGAA